MTEYLISLNLCRRGVIGLLETKLNISLIVVCVDINVVIVIYDMKIVAQRYDINIVGVQCGYGNIKYKYSGFIRCGVV